MSPEKRQAVRNLYRRASGSSSAWVTFMGETRYYSDYTEWLERELYVARKALRSIICAYIQLELESDGERHTITEWDQYLKEHSPAVFDEALALERGRLEN
jgi:hypothetical protein